MALPTDKERDRLVEEHLDYVKRLAHKVMADLGTPNLEFEELVAYGNRGLLEAASRFDATRGVAFTTFSYYRIRGAIYDGLRQIGWLSRSMWARYSANANELLGNQAEREKAQTSTPGQAAESLGQCLDDLATVFLTSMEGNDPALADTETPPSDEQLATAQATTAVRAAIASLPERERELLELHYFNDLNLKECGERLGASKSWASRLHARAIRSLTAALGPTYG